MEYQLWGLNVTLTKKNSTHTAISIQSITFLYVCIYFKVSFNCKLFIIIYRFPVLEQLSRIVDIVQSIDGIPIAQENLQSLVVLQFQQMVRVFLQHKTACVYTVVSYYSGTEMNSLKVL